jgi:hypothetical protein
MGLLKTILGWVSKRRVVDGPFAALARKRIQEERLQREKDAVLARRKKKRQGAMQAYDPMVMALLEQLRLAVFGDSDAHPVHRNYDTDWHTGGERLRWQIWEHRFDEGRVLVQVEMAFGDDDEPTGFICEAYWGSQVTRNEASLSAESLALSLRGLFE